MADSMDGAAGPSNPNGTSRTDTNLLRQFVMEFLQSHGYDKILEMLRKTEDQSALEAGEDGDDATAGGPSGGQERRASAVGREAIFRAPEPVPIESTLKRNIPQAQTISASALSDRITPEFEAQAKYIIEQLQKNAEARAALPVEEDAEDAAGGGKDMMIDTSERVDGYRRFRRWVDDGLDLWKTELDGISFPLFAHTFLDLIHYGFLRAARNFFQTNRFHHEAMHSQELSALSSISSRHHMQSNPLCQRLVHGKYTVPLSRNSHDLLLQWLSGTSLDDEWEAGLQTSAGRAKEAVKAIIFSRIDISVTNQPTPLDISTIAASTGLLSSLVPPSTTINGLNSATTLKLGPAPITEKLKEQVQRTINDEDSAEAPNGDARANSIPNGQPNGDSNGHGNGADEDIEMANSDARQPSAIPGPTIGVKLEISEEDSDLLSPEEGETNPPIPPVFRIADLKREVEAIRDRRKMIRLGPGAVEGNLGGPSYLSPSIVAFTVFDSGEGVSSIEFSHDSSLMAVGSPESCIRLWSLKNEKLKAKSIDGSLTEDEGLSMRKLVGHSGPVYSLSFDPIYGSSQSPQALLSSSQDGTVRLWSLDTYSNLVVYRGHGRDPVWDVSWGPMGAYFATASRDRTARLWSSDRVTPVRMYTGHLSDVNCVRFHPNSLYLATGSNDNSCRLWDVQRGACIRLLLGHTDAVTCVSISPDGRTLASAGLDSTIWLWDLGSSRPIKKMRGHRGPIHTLSWSMESSVLVSGGADCTVRCWDTKSAGGESRSNARGGGAGGNDGDGNRRGTVGGEVGLAGMERGGLPMGPGEGAWEDKDSSSDLISTFHTKRTPVINAQYTPRNLCMVAGSFIPPSNAA